MDPLAAGAAITALVAIVTLFGAIGRRRSGRVRTASTADPDVVVGIPLGSRATLLQFSTDLCTLCPPTARMLHAIADAGDGIRHVEVDAIAHDDLARRHRILQTPTTLVLDGAGRRIARIAGPPRRHELERLLATIGEPA